MSPRLGPRPGLPAGWSHRCAAASRAGEHPAPYAWACSGRDQGCDRTNRSAERTSVRDKMDGGVTWGNGCARLDGGGDPAARGAATVLLGEYEMKLARPAVRVVRRAALERFATHGSGRTI